MYEIHDKKGNIIGYRIQRRVIDENGVKRKETFRSKTSLIHCKRLYTNRLKEIDVAKKRKAEFDYYANKYYELYISKSDSSNGYKNNVKSAIQNHLIPYLGNKQIFEITNEDCQMTINQMTGYSKSSITGVLKVMRQIFKRAVKNELIRIDPSEDVTLPKYTIKERRSITDDERRLLFIVSDYHPAGAMALTMLMCGLRPKEVQNVKWDWIDFNNHTICVKISKTDAGTNRRIPIMPTLEEKLLKLNKENEYVFQIDNKWNESYFYKAWHSLVSEMKAIDLDDCIGDDFTPYLLRHTFCTDCQAAGVPINIAKEFMGHADIHVTANIYTHMVDDVFEKTRKQLNEYSSSKGSNIPRINKE